MTSGTDSTAESLLVAHQVTKVWTITSAKTKNEVNSRSIGPVDLNIHTGEVWTLRGPSGSGKSTLISMLSGLTTATSGTISIGNQRLEHLGETSRAELLSRHIGLLLQEPLLDGDSTPLEHLQLRFAATRQRWTGDEDRRALELLESLGIGHCARRPTDSLSGGERRRTGLAIALFNKPKLLILDEPLSGLSFSDSERVMSVLKAAVRASTALFMATHEVPSLETTGEITLSGPTGVQASPEKQQALTEEDAHKEAGTYD